MTPWTESLTHRCFHSGLKPNGCVDSRRWSTGVVGWVGHVGNPRGVSKPCANTASCPSPSRGPVDQDGASTCSTSRSASRTTVSHSGQLPPSPTERPNKPHSEQRRSPKDCSPQLGHS